MFRSKRVFIITAISTLVLIIIGLKLLAKSPESLLKNAVVVLPRMDSRVYWIDSRRYIKVINRDPTPELCESEWRIIDVVSGTERVVKSFSRADPYDFYLCEPLSSPDGNWIINDCDQRFNTFLERPSVKYFFSFNHGSLVKVPDNQKFLGWERSTGYALLLASKGGHFSIRRVSLPSLQAIAEIPIDKNDRLNLNFENRRFLTTDDGKIISYGTVIVGDKVATAKYEVNVTELCQSSVKSIKHHLNSITTNPVDFPEYNQPPEIVMPSRNGSRLLWRQDGSKLSLLQRVNRFVNSKRPVIPFKFALLYITDLDGKKRVDLGEFEIQRQMTHDEVIEELTFSPDSRSIRFKIDGITYDKQTL